MPRSGRYERKINGFQDNSASLPLSFSLSFFFILRFFSLRPYYAHARLTVLCHKYIYGAPNKSLLVPVLHTPLVAPSTAMPASQTGFFFKLCHIKHKRRILIATILLVLITLCIFLVQYISLLPVPSIVITAKAAKPSVNLERLLLAHRLTGQKLHHAPLRKQIQLDESQELAAVSSFLASLPQNAIPSSVDPLQPIDPQLILDFDTRGTRAEKEVWAMVEDVWTRNPVFLYSKMHSSISREIKNLLASFNLLPAPTIIDVDLRDDASVLIPLLSRLTGIRDLPVLIVGGKVVGKATDIRDLEKSGGLRELILKSGAVIDGAKRKKYRQKT